MERRSADAGIDTLTLLSLTTPFLQLIDAEARGFADDKLVLVLSECDSSWWDVRAVDARVLSELRHHYPGAEDSERALHSGRSHRRIAATVTVPWKTYARLSKRVAMARKFLSRLMVRSTSLRRR